MRFRLPALALLALTAPALASAQKLTVHLKTADGKDAGTATFREMKKEGVLDIDLNLKNLPPGDHGVHIHEKPVCDAPDFKGAGGHFDPDAKQHGYMNAAGHHNGDMPQNITIGADGTGHAHFTKDDLSLGSGKPNDLLHGTQLSNGTSILVHAGTDDEKTDPSGNSGARIACGVIQGREVQPNSK